MDILDRDDPLPKEAEKRKQIFDLARSALDHFGAGDLTDQEVEILLRKSWLEWEPKLTHLLARTGKLEF